MSNNETNRELYKLIGRYEQFSSQVLGELSEVRVSLRTGDERMGKIEKGLAERGVCLVHQEFAARLEKMDNRSEAQGAEIAENKADVRLVKYELSTRDMAKVAALAAGIAAPIIELIKWVFTRTL